MQALKEIIYSLPKDILSGALLSVSLISLTYFIFYKRYKTHFKNWRIQVKERVDAKQLKGEIKNSIAVFIVGALFSSIVLYLNSKGYTKIYTKFSDHHPIFGIGCFFFLLVIDDAWFYWVHRLLHHPKLFPYIHIVHHKSVDVNPFTSVSFHWLEPFLLTLWIFPMVFIFPIYAPMLGLVQLWGLLENIKSHLGYEIYPASFNKGCLKFMTTSTHHNMHHSKFKGNYGVHFRIWDKLFGTEFKDYEATYDAIQHRKKGLEEG